MFISSAFPALAQSVGSGDLQDGAARPVVRPTGAGAGQQLNAALLRLSRDPRNVTALVDAGNAAMALGDNEAAIGFFTRADQVVPGNGSVKAQIASAMLRGEDPLAALRWFDDAQRSGADAVAMAADRGLAYDLVGDNVAAQGQYRLALSRGPNPEAIRRYALSLAIAGDRRGADAVLAPILQTQDRSAWRTRTFILAITGNGEDAASIARASMPADLAASITPYLRYMPRLTPAQQAGAANLGRFPRAADIGRDDPRVVQYAALHPRPVQRVDMALAPQGEPLGGRRDDKSRRRRPDKNAQVQVAMASPPARAVAVPAPPPSPVVSSNVTAVTSPWNVPLQQQARQQTRSVPSPAPTAGPSMTKPVAQPVPQQPPSLAPARVSPPSPGFDLAQAQGSIATPAPVPVAAVPVPTVLSRLDMPPGAVRPAITPPGSSVGAVAKVQPVVTPAPAAPPPASSTTVQQAAPEPVVAPQVAAVVAQPVVQPVLAADDFRSLFNGFQPPVDERKADVAAVDISAIAVRRMPETRPEDKAVGNKAGIGKAGKTPTAKGSSLAEEGMGCEPAQARLKPGVKARRGARVVATDTCVTVARGARPDGPTSVSRTEEKTGKTAKGKEGRETKAAVSHPSRIWIQVLTGSDRDRMGVEWKGLVREAPVLKGKKAFITPWRSNFRLLTGPFESDDAAQTFLNALRKDGVSGFQWTSPAGQVVDALAAK